MAGDLDLGKTEHLAIGGTAGVSLRGEALLKRVAAETGGRAFFPYLIDDLALSFAAIGDELRNQYSLAYIPSGRAPDGKFHKIRVEAIPRDLQVRARSGYYAAQPGAGAPVTISAPPR